MPVQTTTFTFWVILLVVTVLSVALIQYVITPIGKKTTIGYQADAENLAETVGVFTTQTQVNGNTNRERTAGQLGKSCA